MNFEAATTLSAFRGITTRLLPAENRVEVETCGHITPEEVDAAMPALLALLADKSGLPVRHGGKVYRPTPAPARREWGGA